MPDTLERRKLARVARRLNAQSGHAQLPALVFLTDDERVLDPLPAIGHLPRGSLVIVRAREAVRRRELAHAAAHIAQHRGLMLSIAGDAALAAACRADGLHLAEAEMWKAAHHRAQNRHWLITCAAHCARSVLRAHLFGAHAVFLSPIFATQSHADRPPLGTVRLRTIARAVPVAIYALGGIDSHNVVSLNDSPLAGIAAIAALML